MAIVFPITLLRRAKRITIEADCVVFDGPGREMRNTLLLVEEKRSTRDISVEHVSQARSYAQEVPPSYYIVTNAEQIKVYKFNALLAPDDCVMDFGRIGLREEWQQFYGYVSKEAAVKRKKWLLGRLEQP